MANKKQLDMEQAEGSREIVDRELQRQDEKQKAKAAPQDEGSGRSTDNKAEKPKR